jgi:hypothetical protein
LLTKHGSSLLPAGLLTLAAAGFFTVLGRLVPLEDNVEEILIEPADDDKA